MKKIVKCICLILVLLSGGLMSVVVYGFYSLPDEIYSLSDKDIDVGFYTCSLYDKDTTACKAITAVGEYKLNISLFNKIPVKTSNLTVSDRMYVVPSGEIIGLRIFTKGVMVVASETIETANGSVNPAKIAGLQKGDVITCLDGTNIENSKQVEDIITASSGQSIKVEFTRNGKNCSSEITPVYSADEKRYKTGLWIRDSAAGIGTMTFYDKKSGFFACLGHAVCDVDTGEILPLSNGDIVDAQISGCVKGRSGAAGELCGNFKSDSLGTLFLNDNCGVFGYLDKADLNEKEIPVAVRNEIRTGSAYILATVENEERACYEIEIEKLNPDDKDGKNMVIKINDSSLIEKTGGIVQGMSGSPIIQDGKLIGAVTHVFVNDPTRGYGIFAETMLKNAFAFQSKAG